MRQPRLIFLQLLCVVSLGEVIGAARVTRKSDDTICGLLKRVTPKNDTPEGYQLALNVTCTPYGAGRRNYCWEWKNDSGYTCLKRWKTCLKSAFARVSYDLKKVVPVTDHKDYSVIFVRAFKNTTSSTDSYDDVIDNKFQTCLDKPTVKVLTECTGDLTTEDEFLSCSTNYYPPKITTSKPILAGIIASVFGGIALGVITIFVVVTYRLFRRGGQGGPHPLKKRTPTTLNSPSIPGSPDEREPLLNDRSRDSSPSRYDGQRTHPQVAGVEVYPAVIAIAAQPDTQGLTPTPNDFGAGTLGRSYSVDLLGKRPSSSARRKTTSTSRSHASSDDGKKKHHTDVAHDRPRKKENQCWRNDNLQLPFLMDTSSSNGTSDSSHTSMESNKPSAPSKDATCSDY